MGGDHKSLKKKQPPLLNQSGVFSAAVQIGAMTFRSHVLLNQLPGSPSFHQSGGLSPLDQTELNMVLLHGARAGHPL